MKDVFLHVTLAVKKIPLKVNTLARPMQLYHNHYIQLSCMSSYSIFNEVSHLCMKFVYIIMYIFGKLVSIVHVLSVIEITKAKNHMLISNINCILTLKDINGQFTVSVMSCFY